MESTGDPTEKGMVGVAMKRIRADLPDRMQRDGKRMETNTERDMRYRLAAAVGDLPSRSKPRGWNSESQRFEWRGAPVCPSPVRWWLPVRLAPIGDDPQLARSSFVPPRVARRRSVAGRFRAPLFRGHTGPGDVVADLYPHQGIARHAAGRQGHAERLSRWSSPMLVVSWRHSLRRLRQRGAASGLMHL